MSRQRTLIVYMVATNSLSGYDEQDFVEIQRGTAFCDMNRNAVLIYLCTTGDSPKLYEITSEPGESGRKILKSYSSDISSVNPQRISEVINDAVSLRPADDYGMVFWSHGTGWLPENNKSTSANAPKPNNFGPDYREYIDIDRLASALPSGLFSFIWMDCCYMGSIEVAYQFRDKCRYFVGYPTEVLSTGIPYDYTLQYLLSEKLNVIEAAKSTFDYYVSHSNPAMRACTVSVVDMNGIEALADVTKRIFSEYVPVPESGLQCYSRRIDPPFYDFRQYVQREGQLSGNSDVLEEFDSKLDGCVIYKASTPAFLSLRIDPTLFSGLSVHAFNNENTVADRYYMTLDWYKQIYE